MRLIASQKKSPAMQEFGKKEWEKSDKKHFGTTDFEWKERNTYIRAQEGNKILGIIHLKTVGGVGEIVSFIVGFDYHRKGVGTKLMRAAEALAKKQNCHKIFLVTGDGWEAEKFYQKMGFKQIAKLPNHYLKRDFVEFTKFLS